MIGAILLAAGSSRRMGATNKLLLPYQGAPMVVHAAQQLLNSPLDYIVAVLGYEEDKIRPLLEDIGIATVFNPRHLEGMVSSIQSGVGQLIDNTDQFMIALSDMPLITPKHYERIINHALNQKNHPDPMIIRPYSEQKVGHPVIFDISFKSDILNCTNSDSLRSIVKKNKKYYIPYLTEDEAYYRDADTQEAYQKIRNE